MVELGLAWSRQQYLIEGEALASLAQNDPNRPAPPIMPPVSLPFPAVRAAYFTLFGRIFGTISY